MRPPIAFVTRATAEEGEAWLSVLRQAMPQERILAFASMSAADRQAADIAIVANPDPADVAQLTGLSFIHSLWAGVERLVMELGDGAPPIVRLVDPELSRVMGEAVLAWTYYLQRDMPAYRQRQAERLWEPRPYRHPKETTIGLLGLGALGSEAAQRLVGAGFAVQGWSRTPRSLPDVETFSGEDGLDRILSSSDIIVCLLPLTPQTRGLLNAERLARLKDKAALINFARGAIIPAADLIAGLDAGRIAHAVLDVFETEPLPVDSPLWTHPKVTVLPHISAPTTEGSAAKIVAGNVDQFRKAGKLPKTVDRKRGY
ncbi:glyoxylate/hydroxypyruvate reductase A [Rhizobium sp. SSA_523]|uniref:2-hydroxyacid dehydrogenase n=1 Tax=Rhizobium sp. SSA_523 TaxID=2952477 RepID=UPI00209055FB|nr:glyoxylate/hydroxypyruvate reductase A [Rhizobium sp. SSA_523]MCO5733196.1 glyoxylate/hydroxypyruvate reductase A [Rhizobium sp. SSA_523]WKC21813.1 glyoxylate/hydroxypyruvate reductase A [Rhizobium sp. SSA_523]